MLKSICVFLISFVLCAPSSIAQSNDAPTSQSEGIFNAGRDLLIEGDIDGAMSKFEQACRMEAAMKSLSFPCVSALNHYQEGRTGLKSEPESAHRDPQPDKYREFSAEICDLGYASGCINVVEYARGFETVEGYRVQANYLEKACDLDRSSSCSLVGLIYTTDWTGQQRMDLARLFYQKACDLGDQEECMKVAELYRAGKGGPKDMVEALKAVDASCSEAEQFSPELCIEASDFIILYGKETPEMNALVRLYTKRGCDFGTDEACALYAEDLETGEFGSVDLIAAAKARETACHYGHSESCQ